MHQKAVRSVQSVSIVLLEGMNMFWASCPVPMSALPIDNCLQERKYTEPGGSTICIAHLQSLSSQAAVANSSAMGELLKVSVALPSRIACKPCVNAAWYASGCYTAVAQQCALKHAAQEALHAGSTWLQYHSLALATFIC